MGRAGRPGRRSTAEAAPEVVGERLALAGELLTGLALQGTEQREALDGAAGLLAALEAVVEQAGLAAEAGRAAATRGPSAAWLAGTAPHWLDYLDWLDEQLEGRADDAARLPRRSAALAALRHARASCAAARLSWAGQGGLTVG